MPPGLNAVAALALTLMPLHGSAHPQSGSGNASASPSPVFAVAAIKPTDPHIGIWQLQPTVSGLKARGVTLLDLVQEAYATYEANRVTGGPAWMKSERFDVEAKYDAEDVPHPGDLTLNQRRAALQALLADRFRLRVHREVREMPAFALLLADRGPKLHATDAATAFKTSIKGVDSLVRVSQSGHLEGTNFTAQGLAGLLTHQAGRLVIDKTGLQGRYDFVLHWTPNLDRPRAPQAPVQDPDADTAWPALPAALSEQLGLKLQAIKAPVEVIVVDGAEHPAEN